MIIVVKYVNIYTVYIHNIYIKAHQTLSVTTHFVTRSNIPNIHTHTLVLSSIF